MITKQLFLYVLLISMVILGGCYSSKCTAKETKLQSDEEIVALMEKVCNWQLEHRLETVGGKKGDNWWPSATFYTGVMALYETSGDEKYLNALIEILDKIEWKPAGRLRHADDHGVGQTYCDIYFIKKDPKMIAPLKETLDKVVADPKPGRVEWWWCDSLFMAPPTLTRLSVATGDKKYLDFMNTMFWDTHDFLYDKDEHLFYRDKSFFDRREKNGEKVFWSRGNGWVLAGTARVLQYMPEDYPDRPKYIQLFKDMAEKIASVQGEDGLWRPSLLDPESFPVGETSGTGFFTYAIAWGVNNGLLDKAKYQPVAEKRWKGLVGAVHESGKLGFVQKISNRPELIGKDDTEVYATGAFLLSGSEVVKFSN